MYQKRTKKVHKRIKMYHTKDIKVHIYTKKGGNVPEKDNATIRNRLGQ